MGTEYETSLMKFQFETDNILTVLIATSLEKNRFNNEWLWCNITINIDLKKNYCPVDVRAKRNKYG